VEDCGWDEKAEGNEYTVERNGSEVIVLTLIRRKGMMVKRTRDEQIAQKNNKCLSSMKFDL
jgi:hypothetical protein